ncbi:MAG: ferritin [Fusobacteriaceae bacterium]|nr:ferritin [Fusobacteriaceae bacterium]MBP9562288.1 ferritin [Acetoanaerobium sp.]MBU9918251.1 ferritin [Fusobacteriaceae bacterium]
MLSKKVEKALNDQLNMEYSSAYVYQAMAAYFSDINFSGFAAWMDNQAEEERTHARKIYDYILERGGKVALSEIRAPKSQYKSALEAFEDSLKHEKAVTKSIEKLYVLAKDEKDFGTEVFLQWFITEQIEEESTVESIIDKFKMLEGTNTALYLLNNELGSRVRR